MLHLKGEVPRGGSTVLLQYQNPRPFGQFKKMRLIDILGKSKEDTSVFAIAASVKGFLQHSFRLRRLFLEDVTVENVAKRLNNHMANVQDTFSLMRQKPSLGYDSERSKFFVKLSPGTMLATEGSRLLLNLMGFSTAQVKELPKGLFGITNEKMEGEVTVWGEEACPPHMIVTDLFYSLETCTDIDESVLTNLGEGNFELAFHRELPERDQVAQTEMREVDSSSQLAQEIAGLLRELEIKIGLFPGIMAVEEFGEGLAFYVQTKQSPSLQVNLTFNGALAQVMNTPRFHSMRLDPGENPRSVGNRKGEFVTGKIKKLEANLLEKLYPLLLRSEGAGGAVSSLSYVEGKGAIDSLAYITVEGEIVGTPVAVGEFDSSVQIRFYRRDLSELIFPQDTIILAHFRLLA